MVEKRFGSELNGCSGLSGGNDYLAPWHRDSYRHRLAAHDVLPTGGSQEMPTSRSSESESFWPPCCPNPDCSQATSTGQRGFFRHGYYVTRVRGRRVPRFLCRACRRTMSSQTFNVTYRLRRPELDEAILHELAHGYSLRRIAQILGINRKTVSRRLMRSRLQAGWSQDGNNDQLKIRQVAEAASGRETI